MCFVWLTDCFSHNLGGLNECLCVCIMNILIYVWDEVVGRKLAANRRQHGFWWIKSLKCENGGGQNLGL